RHFLPSRPPVFSPSVACQVRSRGRGRSAFFINLTYMDPPRDVKGDSRGKTRVGTDAVIYPYMDSSRPASRKLMSDREPHAYIRPLVGERPPGPDVLRSLSPQRPHGICVPRIQPGWPRDGLTNLLI